MVNSYSPHKALYSNIYAKYWNRNRFAYTSAFQTLINARTNKTLCSSPLYIICYSETLGIMRQNLNICSWKKKLFSSFISNKHDTMPLQRLEPESPRSGSWRHRSTIQMPPRRNVFPMYSQALCGASATSLGPSPYCLFVVSNQETRESVFR